MTTQVSRETVREEIARVVNSYVKGVFVSEHSSGILEATDAIMALIQPVVTDEMVEAAVEAFDAALMDRNEFQADAWRAALTAALPHAVTRDDVLEELAVEAGDMMVAEIGGTNGGACLDLADWLRSRKGGA